MIDEAGILMAETIVVLAPHVRRQQIIERGDRPPPGNLARGLEPLRMLIEHGIDDVNERFITIQKPMPSRQQVPFKPTLAQVLAQDFHDTPVVRHMFVGREDLLGRAAIGHFEHPTPTV